MPDVPDALREPGPLDDGDFPEQAYLASFPDVGDAVIQGIVASGLDHWRRYGQAEIATGQRACPPCLADHEDGALSPMAGPTAAAEALPPRSPTARGRTRRSAHASPDAVPFRRGPGHVGGAPDAADGPERHGSTSAVLPSARRIHATPERPDQAAASSFCEEIYLVNNPDVAEAVAAGGFGSGFEHWRQYGRDEERRSVRPTVTAEAFYAYAKPPPDQDFLAETEGFDAEGYLYLYPDVREAVGGRLDDARTHWREHGRAEGRDGPGAAPYRRWSASVAGMLAKPFGLNIYGPFAATSGLGTAARSMVRAVEAAGISFELHGFDVSQGPPRILQREIGRVPTYRVNLILANADQIAWLAGLYPRGRFDDAYNIAMWAWELAAFRPEWFASFGPLDEVWTNSAFERDAISAIAPVPVTKLRLPVEAAPGPVAPARAAFGIPQDRLVFLTVFDVGSTAARKNPAMVVGAFRRAFEGRDDAFLVVKFHSSGLDPGVTRELNRILRGVDNVLVVADRLAASQMTLLQQACDCLVSAHRSEGFGLNIAEFMAMGKPVIATGYSGNLEFFDASVGYPVEYRLVEVERQAGPYMPGYVWAEPLQDSLVAQMLAVSSDPDEAQARGLRAQARMAADYSVERIGVQLRERLLAIGLDAAMPPFVGWLGAARQIATPALIAPLSAYSRAALTGMARAKPVLSVLVPVHDVEPRYLRECVGSVLAQSYPFWELCLCDDRSTRADTVAVLEELRGTDPRVRVRRLETNLGIAGASNTCAEMASGEFLLMLDNDDVLAPDALLEVARAFDADADIEAMYCDEDKIDETGRLIDHYYKPDFSPEHLESVMYVLHMLVVRKRLFLALGGFRQAFSGAQDYDLMLRISRATTHIHHIPRALYHWRAIPGSAAAVVDAKPYALTAGLRALSEHVGEKYGDGAWVEAGLLTGTFRVRRNVRGTPPVTILILTNNTAIELPGRERFHMVDNLVRSILERTTYPNYEIVVVADDNCLSATQQAEMASRGVRVVRYDKGGASFNYAHKANFSVREARSEHLVLLNDDMEVIGEEWLTALLEFSQDPEIGVVGGRLLHADGTIQHVGTVIGVNDGAAHVYHSFPRDFVGYNGFTHVVRNYSAMTGACLATRKSVLAQVGGLDEGYAVDFNDTDLCLRIVEAGYRIVYTPYCEMYHYESISAVRTTQAAAEKARFNARWAKYIAADPHYNVNLARDRFDFVLPG